MDHAVDISVLEQGGLAKLGSGGDGVDSPSLSDLAFMLTWLDEFHQDTSRAFVVDSAYRLWTEYKNIGEDNYVLRLLNDKFSRQEVRQQTIQYHKSSGVVVPDSFADFSLSCKLVLSVTLTDRQNISVINATDPNWIRFSTQLDEESVIVEQLLGGWLPAFVQRQDELDQQPGDHQYHSPPDHLEGSLADASCVGIGTNHRKAWEKDGRRYEFDSQHNTLEVYRLSNGTWLKEVDLEGNVTKTTGGEGRRWGKV